MGPHTSEDLRASFPCLAQPANVMKSTKGTLSPTSLENHHPKNLEPEQAHTIQSD